jgi:hypothetical protein
MKYEYDIFLSFHKDDDVAGDQPNGWVSSFHLFLDRLLTQLMGEKPKIVLSGAKDVNELAEKSIAMISVLSPKYINTVSTVKEAEGFYRSLEQKNLQQIQSINRVFKVLKNYVPTSEHPDGYKELIGYNLFSIDMESGESVEITDFFDNEVEGTYWLRLVDLAHDLYDLIMVAREKKTDDVLSVEGADEYIYLANPPRDLAIQRDVIRRELQRHGYNILPNQSLNADAGDLEKIIMSDLEKCKLSIHFISGSTYNKSDGSQIKSLPTVQNSIAAGFSKTKNMNSASKDALDFPRFIWIPPDSKISDEQQKLFIENFKRDAEQVAGAEVLSIPLEELKTIIRSELYEINARKNSKTFQTFDNQSGKQIVYLICDKMDRTDAQKLADHLSVAGYEVIVPELTGTILEARQLHQIHLNRCDAVIIYMNKVSEKWVNSKAHDVLKSPGFGRVKTMKCKAVFVEKGARLHDHMFLKQSQFEVLNNKGEFLSEVLRPFTSKV